MNVTQETKKIYGNEVYTAAYIMDQSAVEKIESSYQDAWDKGEGFTPRSMFGRPEDSDAEKMACVKQMQDSLIGVVKRGWLLRYSRDEMSALCGLLHKGPMRQHTRVCLIGDFELDVEEIVRGWNDLHQDERPVYLPDPDIG